MVSNRNVTYGSVESQHSKSRGDEVLEDGNNGNMKDRRSHFQSVGSRYLHGARLDMKRDRSSQGCSLKEVLNTSRRELAVAAEDSSHEQGFQAEPSLINMHETKLSTSDVLKEMMFGKVLNILFLFSPFALYSGYAGWPAASVFWLNFLTMVPLAALLGDFTEEIAAHTNQVIGGLVNATFGNMVEVIIAFQALLAGEIRVVQASMIGSIFSNLLLVLGCCFFFGGLKYKEQRFNSVAAVANMSLLALCSVALVLPTPFAEYYDVDHGIVLTISRIAAIILIIMYVQLLIFQLYTHTHIFEDEEEEEHAIPFYVAIIGLIVTTFSIAIFSNLLVSSIDGYCNTSGISKTFVGIIILPIVGNAVEHMTAVSVAMKNKMDLAMGVAIGSCTQIALFVTPVTVIFGWFMNIPMTLNYPHFEIILFMLSVVIVSITLSTPTTNWLLGSLLILTYVMIAIGFWFEKVVSTVHNSDNSGQRT